MHRIDKPSAAPGNLFTEGNPALAVPATQVSADIMNALQEEIANVVESETPLNKPDNTQLLAAITVKLDRMRSRMYFFGQF